MTYNQHIILIQQFKEYTKQQETVFKICMQKNIHVFKNGGIYSFATFTALLIFHS